MDSGDLRPKGPALQAFSVNWLLFGFALLILPQWARLPIWLVLVTSGLAIWAWAGKRFGVRMPGRVLRILLVLVLAVIFAVTVRGRFTVEAASDFFVLTVALKWLELRSRRDLYVLFFILCYLAAVNFLFRSSPGWALLDFVGILALFNALQGSQGGYLKRGMLQTWKRMGKLFLLALPLVIGLFIFFPRISPLWSVPLVSDRGTTGFSDTVAPGDISHLAQSDRRAFRVRFGGELPPPRERYWRGLVLEDYDGRAWRERQSYSPLSPPGKVNSEAGAGPLPTDEYEVLLEPTYQRWGFALRDSVPVSSNISAMGDSLIRFRRPVDTTVRYRMKRLSVAPPPAHLTAAVRFRDTALPSGGNPKTRAWALSLRARYGTPSAVVAAVLNYFHTQPFYYTLNPPKLGADPMDTLLFQTRRGFCAHYASATAYVLRAAGIPARLVVGYQGGEVGADGRYLIVRQYDAHAWVEVWLGGRWVRVDPTAAIAPERIEQGLQSAVSDPADFLADNWMAPSRYNNIAWVRWINLQMDAFNYRWERWVVGYQGNTQLALFGHLSRHVGKRELGWISAGLVGLFALGVALWSLWRARQERRGEGTARLFSQWRALLSKAGVASQASETPLQIARRAYDRDPALGRLSMNFARQLNSHYYDSSRGTPERELWRQLKRFKRSVRTFKQRKT